MKCCNCGFLALHVPLSLVPGFLETIETVRDFKALVELGLYSGQECTQRGRDRIADNTHADPNSLTCTRYIWSYSDSSDKSKEAVFQHLNSKRKCPHFFPYNPGYSPIEHRELQREAKTQRLLIIGMLLAALIGAVAAIVGQVVA